MSTRTRTRSIQILTLTACAVAAVSCGSGTNSGIAQPVESGSTDAPAATTTSTAASAAPVQTQTQTQTETVTVPATTPAAAQPTRVVPCVDPTSPVVQDALSRIGTDSGGGTFEPYQWTPGTSADGCPRLEWLLANGNGIGDATYQSHVLFFTNDGTFLGTATKKPTSYTQVVGSADTSVRVEYRWLDLPDDAFCCPTGGPSTVDFSLVGDTVIPYGQFPPGL